MKFADFYKTKIQPFLAIGIFIMLILLITLTVKDLQKKTEIAKNCGWGEEDIYCFCEKSEAMRLKNQVGNNFSIKDFIDEDVKFSG